jgi:sigma-B regulation protein RsbU (phosphoserine phosphatase)
LLIPDTRRGNFVSLFYSIVDTQTGSVWHANAGHNPPLLVRVDGSLEPLRVRGMVLGVTADIEPELAQTQLGPGDGLVYYTDGVTEVFNADADIFGLTRLKRLVREYWPAGPQALVSAIRQAVHDFSATTQPSDDFTLVILRRRESEC